MISTQTALALTALLAVPSVVLATGADDAAPATYHLAEDTDARWSGVRVGSDRQPTIHIADDIYPDTRGVQFWVDDEVDDRNPRARPDGFDATGPQDDSTFHVYPQIDLTRGTELEARWHDRDGDLHRSTWLVGTSQFVYGLVGEDVASWSRVGVGQRVEPTIVIDNSIYPNKQGVQFMIDGSVDERSSARPSGFDATGPQENSRYHVYPKLVMREGMQIEARWVDRNGTGRSSVHIIGDGTVVPPANPTPPPPPTSPPVVTTPPTTTPPTTTPPTTTPPTTPEPPVTTVAPAPAGGDAGAAASWQDATAGSNRQPTIVVDAAIYPDGDGVQFRVNGDVDERCTCRPNGFDPTGPQEDSKYHIYPDIQLSGGNVIEARWHDRSGVAWWSKFVVDGSAAPAPPAPAPPPPAPPAPKPTPTPAPSGQRPGSHNTGHDGNLTRTFGSTTIDQAWLNENNGGSRVVENVLFNGGVKVFVDDVTIRNFEVRGGRYGVDSNVFTSRVSGLVLEDGVITGSDSSGLLVANTVARRLEIHEMGSDAVKGFGNVTIESSYIHHLGTVKNSHADGVQVRGGSGYRFIGNYFDMPTRLPGYENSIPIIAQSADGPISDLLIEGNWFNGGGYSVQNRGGIANDRLIDNVFTREHLFGPVIIDGSWTKKSGNRYEDGTKI